MSKAKAVAEFLKHQMPEYDSLLWEVVGNEAKENFYDVLHEINAAHPEHDRSSCSDTMLYNAHAGMLPARCDRCACLDHLWSNTTRYLADELVKRLNKEKS